MFDIGTVVRVKEDFDNISSRVNIHNTMLTYRGKVSEIRRLRQIDNIEAVTLTIDADSWSWDINWLEPVKPKQIKEI